MLGISIKLVDQDIVDAVGEALVAAPGITTTLIKRRFNRVRSKTLAKLRAEPTLWPPGEKRRWKSDRQRIYVIIKLREDGNLPYLRTHNLVNAWEVNLTLGNDGGNITIENNDPAVGFVQGDFTQPMHLDSQWPQAAPIAVEAQDELNDGLIDEYFTATDPFAGVPRL